MSRLRPWRRAPVWHSRHGWQWQWQWQSRRTRAYWLTLVEVGQLAHALGVAD